MAKSPPQRLFIPYLYNYGRCAENFVLVPDLLYRAYPDYGFRPAGAKWWSLRGRLPLRPWVRNWEERRAARAARVLVYSEYVRGEVQRHLSVPPERISLIPLAPPRWMTQQAPAPATPNSWPSRFALYAGGYAVRKNVPFLVEACHRVYEADSSFRCVFVGWNSECGAQSHHARSPAVVPAPSLTNAQLADACRRCEFALYPSHAEGFGLPVIEAAACGKLCLCGDDTSLPEIQLPAFRLPTTEMDPWVREILRYWRDPEAARRAGAACHENSTRFKWEAAAQTLWHLAFR
jgi:glycosyltransferase involved in cell wall biosynthesis